MSSVLDVARRPADPSGAPVITHDVPERSTSCPQSATCEERHMELCGNMQQRDLIPEYQRKEDKFRLKPKEQGGYKVPSEYEIKQLYRGSWHSASAGPSPGASPTSNSGGKMGSWVGSRGMNSSGLNKDGERVTCWERNRCVV